MPLRIFHCSRPAKLIIWQEVSGNGSILAWPTTKHEGFGLRAFLFAPPALLVRKEGGGGQKRPRARLFLAKMLETPLL